MNIPVVIAVSLFGLFIAVATLFASLRNPKERIKLTVPLIRYEGPMIGMLPVSVFGCILIGLVCWSPKSQEFITFLESGWRHFFP
jgi:nitrogen fixation-related uncharacterized protein